MQLKHRPSHIERKCETHKSADTQMNEFQTMNSNPILSLSTMKAVDYCVFSVFDVCFHRKYRLKYRSLMLPISRVTNRSRKNHRDITKQLLLCGENCCVCVCVCVCGKWSVSLFQSIAFIHFATVKSIRINCLVK